MRQGTSPGTTIAAVIILVLLGALLIQFAWNVGLVGALAAAGIAQIGGISYWTATGLFVLMIIIRAQFVTVGGSRGTVVQILKAEDTSD